MKDSDNRNSLFKALIIPCLVGLVLATSSPWWVDWFVDNESEKLKALDSDERKVILEIGDKIFKYAGRVHGETNSELIVMPSEERESILFDLSDKGILEFTVSFDEFRSVLNGLKFKQVNAEGYLPIAPPNRGQGRVYKLPDQADAEAITLVLSQRYKLSEKGREIHRELLGVVSN